MLTSPASPIGDNLMYPFFYLGQLLEKLGHKVATIDTDDIKKFDAIIFIDFPAPKNKHLGQLIKNNYQNLYLITLESPIIKPDNFDKKNHEYFKKIFTWSDELIDNKKYFKINYSYKMPSNIKFAGPRKKLCTLISSNKSIKHPAELYTERITAIRWFEKNHLNDFDLYGKGWNKYYFYGKFLGFNLLRLNRLKLLAKILSPHYPSYKGEVKSKKETLQNYKFAICYENANGFPGYITEKIFDCFFGGCVPIYLGADNIKNHIPENCFIDKRDFKTYDDLYKYIKNMHEAEYLSYASAINNFVNGEKARQFSAEYFADILIREITL
jgi:hypothetical protein